MSNDQPYNDPANLQDQSTPTPPDESVAHRPGDEVMNLLDSLGGQLDALRKHKAEQQAQFLEIAKRQAELSSQDQTLRDREAQLADRLSQLSEQEQAINAARSELHSRQERLSELNDSIESRQRELDSRLSEIERREQDVSASERTAAEHENHELSEARTTIQQLQDALSEALRESDARAAEAGSMRADLERARNEALQSKAALDAVAEKLHDTAQRAATLDTLRAEHAAEIAKYDTAIEALTSRLHATEERLRTANEELERVREDTRLEPQEDVLGFDIHMRRDRLRTYKALLQQQARKIAQAKKVLEKKQGELSKVASAKVEQESTKLSEVRKQIGAERLEVAKLKKSYEARLARTRSMIGVASFFTALTAIVILSWFAAGKIVTPTYVANAAIGINKDDISDSGDEIQSWRSYMDELVNDPQMLDMAAQRLNARGYKEVGNPTDLRAYIASNMDIADRAPGEISLAAKGKGDDRTARLLDTFTQAMVGYANDTRDLRADRATTMVIQAARAEGKPIDDPRLAVAGAIAGAASAVALFMGALLWRSLNQREDNEPQVAFMDDDDSMMNVAMADVEPAPAKPASMNRRPV